MAGLELQRLSTEGRSQPDIEWKAVGESDYVTGLLTLAPDDIVLLKHRDSDGKFQVNLVFKI